VSTPELIEHYESVVKWDEEAFSEKNPHLHEYLTDLRAACENRSILRQLRVQAGVRVCSGDGLCIEHPTCRCMRGVHETCAEHTESCFLCPLPAPIDQHQHGLPS